MPRQSQAHKINGLCAIAGELAELIGIVATQLEIVNPELFKRLNGVIEMAESCIDNRAGSPIDSQLLADATQQENDT